MKIAVIGSGISGLSAAWLLAQRHEVTLYERESRPGGHSHTVDVAGPRGAAVAVDTGFIVYNEPNYPNLTALFSHLGVATQPSTMSFSVSLRDGRLEYCGSGLAGLFAQKANLLRPAFWSLVLDLVRFYRTIGADADAAGSLTLGQYLDRKGFRSPFQDEHILPMAAAIWSASTADMRDYPVAAFARFFANHDLLNLGQRAPWRTVAGGSRTYVRRMLEAMGGAGVMRTGAVRLERRSERVIVHDASGGACSFDHAVIATHADDALALLEASPQEQALLGAFRYTQNRVLLHSDPRFMPRRRHVWSSWNYVSEGDANTGVPCVTYWMNELQSLPKELPLFVTLNPAREPAPGTLHRIDHYAHPLFDARALAAQRELWSLQGLRRTWFCGSYFGSGFHEDGLQAGLAVAEQLGGLARPWSVANASGRIVVGPAPAAVQEERAA
ncbi:MAG: FAD-dependent oxidoreductase [Hyphomicrobiaceae bacterium]|nr:FAD-dependent oxidoreductase [Hyphomicrobiaceae bacterium]